ncbi:hypothetical protein NVP1181O_44 [Vibrio phage 1.181.O._10N.286.46.C9]|nr:hypothetical protein NVP1181O_44 [Vibrio phage 1.181.O._10N.286.46.C9]
MVYIYESGEGYCKIGYSIDVESRSNSILNETGLISTRIMAFKTPFDSKVENRCHKAIRELRVFGEWFKIDFIEACKLVSHIAKYAIDDEIRVGKNSVKCYKQEIERAKIDIEFRESLIEKYESFEGSYEFVKNCSADDVVNDDVLNELVTAYMKVGE